MAFLAYIKHNQNLARVAALRASSEDSVNVIDNVVVMPVAKAFQTAEGNIEAQTIDIDFPFAQAIDTVAVIGHNFTSAATITLKGGAATPPTEVTEALTWRKRSLYKAFSQQAKRYWRLTIDDPSNQQGFLRIGYIVIGLKTQLADGFDFGWSLRTETINRFTDSEYGAPFVGSKLAQRYVLDVNFSSFRNTDRDEVLTWLDDLEREQHPLLVMPDTEDAACLFGRLIDNHSRVQVGYQSASIAPVTFREDGVGFGVIDALPTFLDGDDGYTFARASVASYKDKDLILRSAASDVLRENHYLGYGIRGALLEPGRTNAWTFSEDITNAAWTKDNATPVANQIAAPDLTVTADKLNEASDTAQTHSLSRLLSGTAATVQSGSVFLKAAERNDVDVKLTNTDGAAYVVRVNLTTGALVSETGTGEYSIERYVNGWWRVMLAQDLGSGVLGPSLAIVMRNGDGNSSYNGDGTSGLYVWGLQYEVDCVFPSSYIATGAASAARESDLLSLTLGSDYQPLTIYSRIINSGRLDLNEADTRIVEIDDEGAGSGTLRQFVNASAAALSWARNDGNTETISATVASGLTTAEDMIELINNHYGDGSNQVRVLLNGTNAAASAQSAAMTAAPSEIGADIVIGSWADDELANGFLLQQMTILRGIQSDFATFFARGGA